MRKYDCPACGRFLFASDAPPGYKVRMPKCPTCKQKGVDNSPLLTTGNDARPGPSSSTSGAA